MAKSHFITTDGGPMNTTFARFALDETLATCPEGHESSKLAFVNGKFLAVPPDGRYEILGDSNAPVPPEWL